MDIITQHRIKQKAEDFISFIAAACEVATLFHPAKKHCRIFDEVKKGGFNVCFPVEFRDDSEDGAIPRLAFPMEKLRGEIATMK